MSVNDAIPAEISDGYDPLFRDVCHLHRKWGIFCQLYASGESVVELLNRSAAGFFRICEELLADDILLSISRLMDPKQTFRKDNLTLERLKDSVDPMKYPQLRQDVERLLSQATAKCAFAKDQRDKRIAHSDLSTKLQAYLLPSPPKTNIEEGLQSIRDVMNAVELYFNTPLYVDGINLAFADYSNKTFLAIDGFQIVSRLRNCEACEENRT